MELNLTSWPKLAIKSYYFGMFKHHILASLLLTFTIRLI